MMLTGKPDDFRTILWPVTTAIVIYSLPSILRADDTGRKPLQMASQQQVCNKLPGALWRRSTTKAETFLNQKAEIEYPRGKDGNTLLLDAAERGETEIVKILVDRGAQINPKGTFHGCTPLTQAARRGHMDVVQFLVERKANVNANCTKNGHSFYLTYEGIGPRNPTPLGSAAEGSQIAVIEYLLQKKAKINGRDGSSYTPLMWACAVGSLETVKTLLHHNAEVALKTDIGKTAYDLAEARRDAAVYNIAAIQKEAAAILSLLDDASKQ